MKRRPDSNLTSENWDQEEKEERPGEFQRASKDELDQRKIFKARRRTNAEQTSSATSNIFGGFSGFGGQSLDKPTNFSEPTVSSAFSFLSKINSTGKTDTAKEEKKLEDKVDAAKNIGKASSSCLEIDNKSDENMSEYMVNLKTLNKCILDTISSHLEKTPVCILTPIFEDYESHLKKLKEKYLVADKTNINSTVSETSRSKIESKSSTLFPTFDVNSDSKAPSSNFFSFAPNTRSSLSAQPIRDESLKNVDVEQTNGMFGTNSPKFVFNAQKPFTFSGVTPPPTEKKDNKEDEEDDEDEPPKVEVISVEEKDSKYSKKCKIFVKRDSGYADKGVAMLHLKPVPNSNGTQLLVRANTSLGNILINTLLSAATPVKKMKKNNVLLICIPTPDTVPATPTSVLIRVQTEEMADELLEELKKCISKAGEK